MDRNKTAALWLAQGAAVAALYVVLTLIFAPISFGSVQFRIAEIPTILPLFTPAAVPGLFVGCLLGNILGGAIIWDIVFGSLATLIGWLLGGPVGVGTLICAFCTGPIMQMAFRSVRFDATGIKHQRLTDSARVFFSGQKPIKRGA